jgi:AcrR family transcriptional regulator
MPPASRNRRPMTGVRGGRSTGSRARLLEAAAKVFTAHGYRAATVDQIVAEAGSSKGGFYWNFASKEELFLALVDDRIDRPLRELIELLRSAPAEQDMAPETSRHFFELLERERDVVMLANEYWALAARSASLRAKYAKRRHELRAALAEALDARRKRLGAPRFSTSAEDVATAFLALATGLAHQRLIDESAVPDHLLGEMLALVYAGLVAKSQPER